MTWFQRSGSRSIRPKSSFASAVKSAIGSAARSVVENLESRTMLTGSVTSLVLVNADTNQDILTLSAGKTLNLATLPTRNLNVRANVSGTVESVKFGYDSNSAYHTESTAPYYFAGDDADWTPGVGTHSIKATPFSSDKAAGTAGAGLTFSVTVVDQKTTTTTATTTSSTTTSSTSPRVASLTLVNADTGKDLLTLTDGMTLDVTKLGTRNFNVRANVAGTVESVKFGLDSNPSFKTESTAPYYIMGDAGRWTPAYGAHTLTAMPFTKDSGSGTAGPALTVRLTVTNGTTTTTTAPTTTTTTGPKVTSLTLVNADTGKDLLTLTDGMTLDTTKLGTKNFNVRANIGTGVESVRFGVDSNSNFKIESSAPYYLAGDAGKWMPTSGAHTLVATAYTKDSASGTAGPATTIRINVTSGATFSSVPVTTTTTTTSTVKLNGPSQTIVNAAINAPMIRYGRSILGGAHTNQPADGESTTVLAAAALAGNTSVDSRLLQQIRYIIAPGNEITATGGYPAQHERHATGMFAIVRRVSRVWIQLSPTEQKKIDLVMKAALVASAFTTSDSNPYVLARSKHYALDGNGNMGRDFNPNYREGMIGAMLVGMAYFGGPANAHQVLDTYSHSGFLSELKTYGLNNIYQTFNWKAANPTSTAPSGSMIQTAIKNYKYYGSSLHDYMGIYRKLAAATFGKNVNAGLNYGIGFNNYGKILSGADTLPNKGAAGMLTEFDAFDADGGRSSAIYAYDGYRTHLTNHFVLLAGGYFKKDQAGDSLSRLKVGSTDLWYKLDKGYANYAKGEAQGTSRITDSGHGYSLVKGMWDGVIKPFHGL